MKNNQGTVLLMIIMLMSSCMIFCMIIWKATCSLHDVAIVRQMVQQRSEVMQGYMFYAIEYGSKHFQQLCMQPMTVILQKKMFDGCPGLEDASITVQTERKSTNDLWLHITLLQKELEIKKHCILTRGKNSNESWQYIVHSWSS